MYEMSHSEVQLKELCILCIQVMMHNTRVVVKAIVQDFMKKVAHHPGLV